MDEKKLVFSKDEFDVVVHDCGMVEISAGDKHLLQITDEQFEDIINRRRQLIHGN